MDLLGPLAGFAERFFGNRERRRATDTRIGDKARQLRRQLAASLEDWPAQGPQTLEELVRWAHKFARGYGATDPGVREFVDLRADASHCVSHAVGTVRDHYDAAADIVNPIIRRTWEAWETEEARGAEVAAKLRKAVAHVRQGVVVLDGLTKG
jgi:hypothetical protein